MNNLLKVLLATTNVQVSASKTPGQPVCAKQVGIGLGLDSVETRNSGNLGLPHQPKKAAPTSNDVSVTCQKQRLMNSTRYLTPEGVITNGLFKGSAKNSANSSAGVDVAYRQVCVKTNIGPSNSSLITLSNLTQLQQQLEICDVKITDVTTDTAKPPKEKPPLVHYEDAKKELQWLFELAKQGTVPANLGDFLGKQDFLGYHLMHELFQSVNVIENNQTHTVLETLTIIQNLAPLMISKGLSLHAPDSLGRTPWEFFTHRIFGDWRHLSFEFVKPIFDLIMELTPKNDPYIQMAIGNLFIQSVTSKEDQGLMNYTIELIKAYSLDINYQSPKVGMNRTALHRAAELGDESIVLMLLNMGADPTIKDTHGNTPWDLVGNGTRLDKILYIAKILHPLMGASFNKLPMEAESWLGIYRRYRQFHDGILHVVTDPSNEQIKANLLKNLAL